jgi:endonuclease-3
MQMGFDFGADDDIKWIRDQLRACFGRTGPIPLRTPIDQLVKSSISGRTRDEISLRAYWKLTRSYPGWSAVAAAPTSHIETAIADVTFPDVKARHVRAALRAVAKYHADFDLSFLGRRSVTGALAWLERLPGVGRKVAASTLNFSTLHMPAFVVDTHVLRILRRFGFVRSKADTSVAYDSLSAALHDWNATDLAELHILMKNLGQTICRADRADCLNCPISRRCQAFSREFSGPSGWRGKMLVRRPEA